MELRTEQGDMLENDDSVVWKDIVLQSDLTEVAEELPKHLSPVLLVIWLLTLMEEGANILV